MNPLDWFKNVSLTTKVLAGAAAVAGAGLVAVGIATGPTDRDTAFYDAGSQGNVAFTSGSSGHDDFNSFASNDLARLTSRDLAEQRAQQAKELQASQREFDKYYQDDSPAMEGYQLSNVPGGLNSNNVHDADSITTAFGSSAPDLQGLMQNAMEAAAAGQKAAQGGADGKGGENGAIPTLQRASLAKGGSFNGSNGISAGGDAVQNTWSAGMSKDVSVAVDALGNAAQMVQKMEQGAGLVATGGALNNKARFASEVIDSNSSTSAGRRGGKGVNDLDYAFQKSKVLASSKNLGSSDLAKPFLGGEQLGGITIGGTVLTESLGNGATDDQKFNIKQGLAHAGAYLDSLQEEVRERTQDGNSLKKHLWLTFGIVLTLAMIIPYLKHIPIFGKILAAAALVIGLIAIAALGVHIGTFSHKWDFSGIAITSTAVGAVMTAGLLLSFIKYNAWYLIQNKVFGLLGFNTESLFVADALVSGGAVIGAAGTAAVAGAASEAIGAVNELKGGSPEE